MPERLLKEEDLPDLMRLKTAAGWNQTEDDWKLLLRFEPGGCFGIEENGHVVATAAAVCYGGDLAWIGMVLTLPEFRGRGLARRLTQTAVDYAGQRICRLDASDMGQPLYASLGFRSECLVERWRREPGPAPPAPEVAEFQYSPELDTRIFGADRSKLIRELAAEGEAASVPGGYAIGRAGSNGPFFGPCVAEDSRAAEALLRWYVKLHETEAVYTDLFPHHRYAVRIAGELGFTPVRRLTRMVYGTDRIAVPNVRIYATGSFSWG